MCSHNTLPNQKDKLDHNNNEVWTTEYLVDQLFLDLARVKNYVENDKKQKVTFRKITITNGFYLITLDHQGNDSFDDSDRYPVVAFMQ